MRRRRKKEENEGKMKKSVQHRASGRAFRNAASEGKMKAIVTSHHAKLHTHAQPGCAAAETHGPAEPSFEKKKAQREWKRRKKNKREEATVLDVSFWPIFVLTHKSNRHWGAQCCCHNGVLENISEQIHPIADSWWHEQQLGIANNKNNRKYTTLTQVNAEMLVSLQSMKSIPLSLQKSSLLSVFLLAHSMASLLVYEQGEDRLALRLRVWSGCVYVCLALEPGTRSRAPAHPGHHTKHCWGIWRRTLSDNVRWTNEKPKPYFSNCPITNTASGKRCCVWSHPLIFLTFDHKHKLACISIYFIWILSGI